MRWIRRGNCSLWFLLVVCTLTASYIFMKSSYLKTHDNLSSTYNGKPADKLQRQINIFKNNDRMQQKVKRGTYAGQLTKKKLQRPETPMPYLISEPPFKRVAFLKVDQAESTVIQNMLFRFGIKHGLTFVLPKQGHVVKSNKEILYIKRTHHFDMFACQTTYSEDRFRMMKPGYKTLAIVREPLQRMISATHFYRNVIKLPYLTNTSSDNFIKELINNYQLHDPDIFSQTRNSMAFDFGFSNQTSPNDTKTIEKYLLYIRKQFSQVLIAERLDESLVLMRREYNWMYKDIVYLNETLSDRQQLNPTAVELETFNMASRIDYTIYNMFYKIFDTKIKAFGKDNGKEFKAEVGYFRQILYYVNRFCQSRMAKSDLTIADSIWHEEFKITREECEMMKLNETDFTEKMKVRHEKMNE